VLQYFSQATPGSKSCLFSVMAVEGKYSRIQSYNTQSSPIQYSTVHTPSVFEGDGFLFSLLLHDTCNTAPVQYNTVQDQSAPLDGHMCRCFRSPGVGGVNAGMCHKRIDITAQCSTIKCSTVSTVPGRCSGPDCPDQCINRSSVPTKLCIQSVLPGFCGRRGARREPSALRSTSAVLPPRYSTMQCSKRCSAIQHSA